MRLHVDAPLASYYSSYPAPYHTPTRSYPLVRACTAAYLRLPPPTSPSSPLLSPRADEQWPRGRRQAGGSRGEREEGAEERRARGRRMGSAHYPSPWRRRGSPSAAARPPSRRLGTRRRSAERSLLPAIGERERRGPPVSRRGERTERARGHATRRAGRRARSLPASYPAALAALSPHSPTCHLPLSLSPSTATPPHSPPHRPTLAALPLPSLERTRSQPQHARPTHMHVRAERAGAPVDM